MAQTKAFNGQREGEELLFVFRRHIIAMRKGFYMLLLPLAVGARLGVYWLLLSFFDVALHLLHRD